jgi:hypothetical protein
MTRHYLCGGSKKIAEFSRPALVIHISRAATGPNCALVETFSGDGLLGGKLHSV